MANIKEEQRTEEIRILMTPREKEMVWKYAEKMGMKPSRLMRNIVMIQTEGWLRKIQDPACLIYKKYLEICDPKLLKELSEME